MAGPEWLVLLRHAKSSWSSPSLGDHDRPLNARGRDAAARMGRELETRGLRPDRALVSTSKRTRETWERVSRAFPEQPEASFHGAIYEASATALLTLLRNQSGPVRTLLMLGHNPSTGWLAQFLAGRDHPQGRDYRFLKFPTAAAAVFRVSAGDWSALAPETAALALFLEPHSLGG